MFRPDIRFGLNWFTFLGLAILPLLVAGLFILYVVVQIPFQYDKSYFTPQYYEMYNTPSTVAVALEEQLRTGDARLYSELTGLRRKARTPQANPNMALTIVLEVDEHGYYHYLYFDVKTYRRAVHYIKEVRDRWVVVPEDAIFAYQSGRWLLTFGPLVAIWWAIVIFLGLGGVIYTRSARLREDLARGLKE
jgi:hypothetical protein